MPKKLNSEIILSNLIKPITIFKFKKIICFHNFYETLLFGIPIHDKGTGKGIGNILIPK